MSATAGSYEPLFAPERPADGVELDVEALAVILRDLDELDNVEAALRLASLGLPIVACVPGQKAPLLTSEHTRTCAACITAGLTAAPNHGETTDPAALRTLWTTHPDAGVAIKNHPCLVRGDGDFEDAAALKKARRAIGYGQPGGCAEPFAAYTPGGQYRRRFLHSLPKGVPAPGGGTRILGVGWYGTSGIVVVKGRHPSGRNYMPFSGDTITPLPDTIATILRRNGSAAGVSDAPATDSDVAAFLAAHTGTARLANLDRRRRLVEAAGEGDRHHTALGQLTVAAKEAVAGHYPARLAHDVLHKAWRQTMAGGRDGRTLDNASLSAEWTDIARWAIGQVSGLTVEQAQRDLDDHCGKRHVIQLDTAYPASYIDAIDSGAPRDLTIAELDAIERQRQPTITSAADDDPARLSDRLLTVQQLRDLPPPRPLIDGVLDLDNLGLLYGRRGSLKSFLALDWSLSVATGEAWAGHDVHQGPVVYIAAEGLAGIYQRITAWAIARGGLAIGDNFRLLPEALNLLSATAVEELADTVANIGAALIVVDTLARCMVGGDENSAKDVGLALNHLDLLRRRSGALILPVHHSGKDPKAGARGSSALEGAADSVFELATTEGIGVLRCTKQKNRAETPTIHLRSRPTADSLTLDLYDGANTAGLTDSEQAALDVLADIAVPEGVSVSDWVAAADEAGVSRATVMRARTKGLSGGLITLGSGTTTRHPKYTIADGGSLRPLISDEAA